MRCERDIAQRAAAGLLRVGQPGARGAERVEPIVRRGFGEHGPPDGAGLDQFARAVHLGIHAPVVGDAECAARLFGCLLHGVVPRHSSVPWAFRRARGGRRSARRWSAGRAEIPASRCKPPWRRSAASAAPGRSTPGRRTARLFRDRGSRFRPGGCGFRENRGQHTFAGNIADADYQPGEHRGMVA